MLAHRGRMRRSEYGFDQEETPEEDGQAQIRKKDEGPPSQEQIRRVPATGLDDESIL
jgi:hypothetical protein